MSDSITCPKCKTEIPLSKAITHHVEERLRAEFDAEKERLLADQAKQLGDKDLILEQMNRRIEDLQAAADQKRSGLQGEVLEREIEEVLRDAFPTDAIDPVKSGKRGADVVQRVRSGRGDCGKLLWESKN